MNTRLIRTVWVFALLSVVFAISMCSYTSFALMNMGSAHPMDMNDSTDHANHAISLSTAILPVELSLLVCSVAFILLLKFFQTNSNLRFAYKRIHYESRPPSPVNSLLSFSLRSPPARY